MEEREREKQRVYELNDYHVCPGWWWWWWWFFPPSPPLPWSPHESTLSLPSLFIFFLIFFASRSFSPTRIYLWRKKKHKKYQHQRFVSMEQKECKSKDEGKSKEHKLWGGRFSDGLNPLMEQFNASISFDRSGQKKRYWVDKKEILEQEFLSGSVSTQETLCTLSSWLHSSKIPDYDSLFFFFCLLLFPESSFELTVECGRKTWREAKCMQSTWSKETFCQVCLFVYFSRNISTNKLFLWFAFEGKKQVVSFLHPSLLQDWSHSLFLSCYLLTFYVIS